MPLAYFDLDDLKVALEAVALVALLMGVLGYVLARTVNEVLALLSAALRRRGAAAPFDARVRAAQRRHVLIARALQARINREERRLAGIPSAGSHSR